MTTLNTPSTIRRLTRPGAAALLAAAGLALAACATPPPPTEQLAVSQAAVTHAVGAGAPELAPAELSLARDKLGRAQAAVVAKNFDVALALAQEAQLDAQLAEAKAESTKARKAADALQDASRALRQEISRKTTTTQ
jgi:septal ring factor EnvC (AmiA/AmiB activator)